MSGDDDETLKGPYLEFFRPPDRDVTIIRVHRLQMVDGEWIMEVLQPSGEWMVWPEGTILPDENLTLVLSGQLMHALASLDDFDNEVGDFFDTLCDHLGVKHLRFRKATSP